MGIINQTTTDPADNENNGVSVPKLKTIYIYIFIYFINVWWLTDSQQIVLCLIEIHIPRCKWLSLFIFRSNLTLYLSRQTRNLLRSINICTFFLWGLSWLSLIQLNIYFRWRYYFLRGITLMSSVYLRDKLTSNKWKQKTFFNRHPFLTQWKLLNILIRWTRSPCRTEKYISNYVNLYKLNIFVPKNKKRCWMWVLNDTDVFIQCFYGGSLFLRKEH